LRGHGRTEIILCHSGSSLNHPAGKSSTDVLERVAKRSDPGVLRAVKAAIDGIAMLDAMADHLAAAVVTGRRERMDRTLERI
jgi:hypothetical protein